MRSRLWNYFLNLRYNHEIQCCLWLNRNYFINDANVDANRWKLTLLELVFTIMKCELFLFTLEVNQNFVYCNYSVFRQKTTFSKVELNSFLDKWMPIREYWKLSYETYDSYVRKNIGCGHLLLYICEDERNFKLLQTSSKVTNSTVYARLFIYVMTYIYFFSNINSVK